jgi:hypothetical protein
MSLGCGRRSQAWFPGAPRLQAGLLVSVAHLRHKTSTYALVSAGMRGWRERMWLSPRAVPASLPLPRPSASGSPRTPRFPAKHARSVRHEDGTEPAGPVRMCGRVRVRIPGNSTKWREFPPPKKDFRKQTPHAPAYPQSLISSSCPTGEATAGGLASR